MTVPTITPDLTPATTRTPETHASPAASVSRPGGEGTALTELGHAVAVEGLAAHEHRIRTLLAVAADHGVSPALLSVLADRTQPDVARERALARVVVAVA
jgi:hypothetical protein